MATAAENLASLRRKSTSTTASYLKRVGNQSDKYTQKLRSLTSEGVSITDTLLNNRKDREDELERVRDGYTLATSTVLNERALDQLAKHSSISAPTLTSIYSGYEHARASEAARIGTLIDKQETRVVRDNSADVLASQQQQQSLRDERALETKLFSTTIAATTTAHQDDRSMDGTEFATVEGVRTDGERRTFTTSEREGSQVFRTGERREGQEFSTSEREGGQKFRAGERREGQEFSTSERREGQDFRISEREGDQEFRTSEREGTQQFKIDNPSTSSGGKRGNSVSAVLRSMGGRSSVTPTTPSSTVTSTTPQSFSSLIRGAESPVGAYRAFNRGRSGDSSGKTVDFSTMKIGEIKRRQALPSSDPESLRAIGAYQMIPSTFLETTESMSIGDDELLTDDLQDRMMTQGLIDKRPAVKNYLLSVSDDLGAAITGTSLEWAGVMGTDGKGAHDDVGGNVASVGNAALSAVLMKARTEIASAIAGGASPEDAIHSALMGTALATGDDDVTPATPDDLTPVVPDDATLAIPDDLTPVVPDDATDEPLSMLNDSSDWVSSLIASSDELIDRETYDGARKGRATGVRKSRLTDQALEQSFADDTAQLNDDLALFSARHESMKEQVGFFDAEDYKTLLKERTRGISRASLTEEVLDRRAEEEKQRLIRELALFDRSAAVLNFVNGDT